MNLKQENEHECSEDQPRCTRCGSYTIFVRQNVQCYSITHLEGTGIVSSGTKRDLIIWNIALCRQCVRTSLREHRREALVGTFKFGLVFLGIGFVGIIAYVCLVAMFGAVSGSLGPVGQALVIGGLVSLGFVVLIGLYATIVCPIVGWVLGFRRLSRLRRNHMRADDLSEAIKVEAERVLTSLKRGGKGLSGDFKLPVLPSKKTSYELYVVGSSYEEPCGSR